MDRGPGCKNETLFFDNVTIQKTSPFARRRRHRFEMDRFVTAIKYYDEGKVPETAPLRVRIAPNGDNNVTFRSDRDEVTDNNQEAVELLESVLPDGERLPHGPVTAPRVNANEWLTCRNKPVWLEQVIAASPGAISFVEGILGPGDALPERPNVAAPLERRVRAFRRGIVDPRAPLGILRAPPQRNRNVSYRARLFDAVGELAHVNRAAWEVLLPHMESAELERKKPTHVSMPPVPANEWAAHMEDDTNIYKYRWLFYALQNCFRRRVER
jgi:hypothetical protein